MNELIQQKMEELSDTELAEKKEAWLKARAVFIDRIIGLRTYDNAALDSIKLDLSKPKAFARFRAMVLNPQTKPSLLSPAQLARLPMQASMITYTDKKWKCSIDLGMEYLTAIDSQAAIPILNEVLENNELIGIEYDSYTDPVKRVHYPLREQASQLLAHFQQIKKPINTAVTATSNEGKARIKKALLTGDLEQKQVAAKAAGYTQDSAFIPHLIKLSKESNDQYLNQYIIVSLARLQGSAAFDPIIDIIITHKLWDIEIHEAAVVIGPKETFSHLSKQILQGDTTERKVAANMLITMATFSSYSCLDPDEVLIQKTAAETLTSLIETKDEGLKTSLIQELIDRYVIVSEAEFSTQIFDPYLIKNLETLLTEGLNNEKAAPVIQQELNKANLRIITTPNENILELYE